MLLLGSHAQPQLAFCAPADTLSERLFLLPPQSLRGALKGASGVIFAASGTGYWSAKGVDYQASKLAAIKWLVVSLGLD